MARAMTSRLSWIILRIFYGRPMLQGLNPVVEGAKELHALIVKMIYDFLT